MQQYFEAATQQFLPNLLKAEIKVPFLLLYFLDALKIVSWYCISIIKENSLVFQKYLSSKFILNVWKAFREGGTLSEGKITRPNFKRAMLKQCENVELRPNEIDALLEAIFERFKIEKFERTEKNGQDAAREEEKIDIQDLVVSLTVLAHMDTEEKLELIFQLTDVDEDGCLSIDDIFQMIKRIERNFSKESTYIVNNSAVLHHELSQRRAVRKFALATQKIERQVGDSKSDDLGLIERKSFLESLKMKMELYNNFLPQNFQLSQVLLNTSSEQQIEISESSKQEFDEFRKDIHSAIRNSYKDKYSQQYIQEQKGIRFPGKIEVVVRNPQTNEKKTVETLPNFEKTQDKKSVKSNAQSNNQSAKASKNDYQKQMNNQNKEESDSNNNLEIHKKRLQEMQERSRGWTLGFKRNKYGAS